jgi:bacteriophage N4 adsorption protein B
VVWSEPWLAACLAVLAAYILLSGLDDLFIDVLYFLVGRKPFPWPTETELAHAPELRIAILVPLWREHEVIGQMLEHNLSVIRYGNYDVFAGVYLNDAPTREAVQEIARHDSRVHTATCPHPGPTSKGDCLNWLYRRMAEYEARHSIRFEIVMIHDAEDLVHPDSLRLVNWFSRDYQMTQVPVLPLPTRLGEWTHGLYCDEFAEYQSKDIPVRQHLGGFLPSNGVGTAFVRDALEHLATGQDGCIFDPECLTEDYETGFRLHAAGYAQVFLPIRFDTAGPVATREYFPRRWRGAVRQRSRWVTGIALQSWQRHGWRVPAGQIYWFWRDRKGLAGNLISPIANVFFFWCLWSKFLTDCSESCLVVPPWTSWVCAVSSGIAIVQLQMRMYLSHRVYGMRFAAAVPLRVFWGNVVNCAATAMALSQFAIARLKRCSVAWKKTQHDYPADPVRALHWRPGLPLGDGAD